MLPRKLNVYGIVLAPQTGGYPLAILGLAPPQPLAAVMVTPAFFVHWICMSGVIVALVEPATDGSMLKAKVPADCETTHVFITVPLTLPAGSVAIIDPPPACVQLIVNVIA